MAVIVDAADYFATVRRAVLKARYSVLFIGWDFDTRITLDRPGNGSPTPNTLGKFLKWVVRQRPELQIHVLRWDVGALHALGRGSTPLVILDWMIDKRIHFKLDGAHPAGAAHHQKIVVIDDALAFCGGIDMTADRWDTRAHLDDDPNRVRPTTHRRYGPWHDVSTAVDGDAARALGQLARERWRCATGEELEPPPPTGSAWPDGLDPSFRDVDVAISRTAPEYGDRPAVHEIEALYMAAIAAARKTLYIESQYFASRKIAEAMSRRLRESNGPEIIVVNPETADGWLEEEVMGSSRARLLRLIREADRHRRFRLYTPVTSGGAPIYVHAKVMVVDDRLLRVGSSNLNNRSLGFDTECDLSVEALPGAQRGVALSRSIVGLRNDLLAEHLGVPNAVIEEQIRAAGGSVIRAIEALRSDGKSLRPFQPPALNDVEATVLGENQLLDPERPASRWRSLRRGLRRALSTLRPK
nr:phospholipase D-like domain-containing protein [Propylenella binzhouense]